MATVHAVSTTKGMANAAAAARRQGGAAIGRASATSDSCIDSRYLCPPEGAKGPLAGDQLVPRATLDDAARGEHVDGVCPANGRQPMRDEENCKRPAQACHRLEDLLLVFGIERARRLV